MIPTITKKRHYEMKWVYYKNWQEIGIKKMKKKRKMKENPQQKQNKCG